MAARGAVAPIGTLSATDRRRRRSSSGDHRRHRPRRLQEQIGVVVLERDVGSARTRAVLLAGLPVRWPSGFAGPSQGVPMPSRRQDTLRAVRVFRRSAASMDGVPPGRKTSQLRRCRDQQHRQRHTSQPSCHSPCGAHAARASSRRTDSSVPATARVGRARIGMRQMRAYGAPRARALREARCRSHTRLEQLGHTGAVAVEGGTAARAPIGQLARGCVASRSFDERERQ